MRAAPKTKRLTDAFLSHDSEDKAFAYRLEKSLQAVGFSVWVDHSHIRAGGLLVTELQEALQRSRNVLVLWSRASSKSEWVNTEWTSVVNLNHREGTVVKKGVIPCLLDDTELALFLMNYFYCDFQVSYDAGLQQLRKALEAPIGDSPSPAKWNPSDFVKEIYHGQNEVLTSLSVGNLTRAKKLQARLNSLVRAALRQDSKDRYILNLAGYNKKNEYLIRHWEEVQLGRPPKDNLLNEAMEIFFMVLSIQPEDPSALNGIGSVMLLRRDLDAAEFYIRRALDRAKEEHLPYEAAEHDLELVEIHKANRKAKRT
jgi:tetratricopeptide (TPR) repeat protein